MKLNAVSGIMLILLLTGTLILIFGIQHAGSSEPPVAEWTGTYGGSNLDRLYCVIQSNDGVYTIVGETRSWGAGGVDIWLVKTNSTGVQEWMRTYGGVGADHSWGKSVVQTIDGGYAIAGYTNSFGVGGFDFWLIKTDASGNLQWNRTYGGGGDDWARSLMQTSDEGYAIIGYTNSYGAGFYDFWLVKTDSSGTMLWNKTYGGADNDYAHSVIQTGDGGYAVSGSTYSFGAGSYDFWLVKADMNGNQEWTQTYGGISADASRSVVQTHDGGYAIAGYTNSFGAGDDDFWLVRTDYMGNHLWDQTYGGAGMHACL